MLIPWRVISGDLCCWPHLSLGKRKKLPISFPTAHIGASKRSVFFWFDGDIEELGGGS